MAQSRGHLSDEEIVQRVLEGDRESFGILFDRYYFLVFRLALTKLGDSEMAQDAAQDAFLRGYNHLDRLRDASSFGAWMAGITRNLCRNLRRNMGRRPVSLEYLAEVGIEPPDPGRPFSLNTDQLAALKRILPSLPEKYREILELRYTEECSCKKIASFLDLSLSAVKSRLYHARKLILKRFQKERLE